MPHSISIKSHLHEMRWKRKKTKIQSSGNSLNLSRITNNKKRINKQQTTAAAATQHKQKMIDFFFLCSFDHSTISCALRQTFACSCFPNKTVIYERLFLSLIILLLAASVKCLAWYYYCCDQSFRSNDFLN